MVVVPLPVVVGQGITSDASEPSIVSRERGLGIIFHSLSLCYFRLHLTAKNLEEFVSNNKFSNVSNAFFHLGKVCNMSIVPPENAQFYFDVSPF